MKLSVNHSKALLNLLHTGEVHVDAIEVVPHLSHKDIVFAQSELPNMVFTFHHGRMSFSASGIDLLTSYMTLCPQSPFISIHLAPLPFYITKAAMKESIFLPEPDEERCIRRFINSVKRLKNIFTTPVILENMAPLHPEMYRFECEPLIIQRVFGETDCSMLLDLAHAKLSAEVREMAVEDYLLQLPLDRVVQIHMAGIRQRDGRSYDAHESLQKDDYSLLRWTLNHTQPQWLTLEYFYEDRGQVKEQVLRLSQF